jgi:hypothetical protein
MPLSRPRLTTEERETPNFFATTDGRPPLRKAFTMAVRASSSMRVPPIRPSRAVLANDHVGQVLASWPSRVGCIPFDRSRTARAAVSWARPGRPARRRRRERYFCCSPPVLPGLTGGTLPAVPGPPVVCLLPPELPLSECVGLSCGREVSLLLSAIACLSMG